MEKIAEIIYNSYVASENERKVKRGEDFYELEHKLINSLSREQFDLYSQMEMRTITYFKLRDIKAFEYLLNLIQYKEE